MIVCAASNNAGKLKELRRILERMGHEVKSLRELGITLDPEETGTTFAENAVRKAKAVWEKVKLPVIADDSGLCVDALDGRPGIYSARYAGEGATDADRVKKLLAELEGKENRTGRFVCAIAYIDGTGETHVFEGVCEGTMAESPRGEDGFGYDPIFLVGEKTFAEMTAKEKDAVSHRGKANRLLEDYLKQEK